MAPSPVTYLTLADLCERWNVKLPQIAAVALESKLRLSVPVPGIYAEVGEYVEIGDDDWQRMPNDWRHIYGVYDLFSRDAWELIRNGSKLICNLRNGEDGYIDLEPQGHQSDFSAVTGDILIRRDEVERFEAESAPAPRDVSVASAARGGPGAPPKYDWESFWIETCRRLHDDGPPSTQKEMVLNLLGWFDDKGAAVPDESTVKKKVSKLWKALGLVGQGAA
jgi:hypothetical protein